MIPMFQDDQCKSVVQTNKISNYSIIINIRKIEYEKMTQKFIALPRHYMRQIYLSVRRKKKVCFIFTISTLLINHRQRFCVNITLQLSSSFIFLSDARKISKICMENCFFFTFFVVLIRANKIQLMNHIHGEYQAFFYHIQFEKKKNIRSFTSQ